MANDRKKIVVIGGGASGFFCAINVARLCPDADVLILEKTNKLLSKVRVSGGGRCNVTNHEEQISILSKKYPRGEKFVKKTLNLFNTENVKHWFLERKVALRTEPDGRVFPNSNSSHTIIDLFMAESQKYKVEILTGYNFEAFIPDITGYTLHFNNQDNMHADYLVFAMGGHQSARFYDTFVQSGYKVFPPKPSLFTFNIPNNSITELAGISVKNAIVKIAGEKLQEQKPLLITHWGLSGPAILCLSAFGAEMMFDKSYNFQIIVNWIGLKEDQVRETLTSWIQNHPKQKASNGNALFEIPSRLWDYLLMEAEIDPSLPWNQLNSKLINKLLNQLTAQSLAVEGKTTFKEEFVTAGGIDVSMVNGQTMESILHPNIYFIGELLNVDGITGGFNFQNAWTTAMIAAKSIQQMIG